MSRRGSSSFPRRGASHRARPPMGMLWAALALLLVLPTASPVSAEPDGDTRMFGAFSLLWPIRENLGGTAWLAASGLHPRTVPYDTYRGAEPAIDLYAPAPGSNASAVSAQPLVPFREPGPSFSRNILITRSIGLFGIQTEPSIAVDPLDPEHLVMGTIDYNFPSISTYTSFDGGETWDGPHQIRYFQEDLTGAGDPVVAFGQDGTVYITMISLGLEEFRLGSIASFTEVSSMIVSRSLDGGISWSDPVSAARSRVVTTSNPDTDGRERGTITSEFLDKMWLTVGSNPDDPSRDIIHLTYTEFATTYGVLYADELPFLSNPFTETTIRYVRSLDGGMTWSTPIAVSPTVLQAEGASEEGEGGFSQTGAVDDEGNPITSGGGQAGQQPTTITQILQESGPAAFESDRTVQGSQPKVMSDGTIVVAYLDTTNDGVQEGLASIMVTTSVDGVNWTRPVLAAAFREPRFSPRSSTFRWWGTAFPQLAVGPGDEVYVAVTFTPTDKPADDGDIFFLRSLNQGMTWDTPVRLNGDDTVRAQFFPSIDVAPDGSVHVMWADMRDDPDEVRYHIYYTSSTDGGDTWGFTDEELGISTADTRVSDFASNSLRGFPGGRFIGDYFSLAATDEDVYMVWADTRLGEFAGPNQQIAFARKTAIRNPSIFLNPPSGVAGREVTIQGSDFQPDATIFITLGDSTIATARTNERGQFTVVIFMPITGEGASNIAAFDESGNVAISSYFTEVGFDTLVNQITSLQNQLATAQAGPAEPTATATPASAPVAVSSPVATPRSATPVGSPVASVNVGTATGLTEGGLTLAGMDGLSTGTLLGLAGYAVGVAGGAAYALNRWRVRQRRRGVM